MSRSTVSRFLNGTGGSIRAALAILAELGLKFDDVAVPCDETGKPLADV